MLPNSDCDYAASRIDAGCSSPDRDVFDKRLDPVFLPGKVGRCWYGWIGIDRIIGFLVGKKV